MADGGRVKIERNISKISNEKFQMADSWLKKAARSPKIVFWTAVAFSQVIGIILVALVGYWCTLNGGFGWASNANLQFNFHPLLMILGLIFCFGDAIIIYRVLSFLPKWLLKILHASLHISAIVCSSVALVAAFENHRRTNRADMYSLHSWVGITTFSFFCLQYLLSFVTFLFPGLPLTLRAKVMPFHTFLGIGIFALAVATVQMGLTEKLIWSPGYTSGTFNEVSVVGNIIGIFTIVFAFLIIFITTHAEYKRKPLPDELPQSTVN